MATITVKTLGGEMLDQVAHRHYKGRPGALDVVIAANPGLSKIGPVLPAGVDIVLPDLPEVKNEGVTLWD
jgi:phage tail protein X